MNNAKISVIITAGGTSTRFGSNKLLEKLDKLSVIETTVMKFINKADEIIIPAIDETREFLLQSKIYNNKIKFCHAGKTRQESVYNALSNCRGNIVLIHDGARPFISELTIEEAIELTKKHGAVIVGKMAIDTIKRVEAGKIIETLDRRQIFQAQTPQCFELELIKSVHEKYKNKTDFTDDSSMIEAENIKPVILIVKGKNEKITIKEDLNLNL